MKNKLKDSLGCGSIWGLLYQFVMAVLVLCALWVYIYSFQEYLAWQTIPMKHPSTIEILNGNGFYQILFYMAIIYIVNSVLTKTKVFDTSVMTAGLKEFYRLDEDFRNEYNLGEYARLYDVLDAGVLKDELSKSSYSMTRSEFKGRYGVADEEGFIQLCRTMVKGESVYLTDEDYKDVVTDLGLSEVDDELAYQLYHQYKDNVKVLLEGLKNKGVGEHETLAVVLNRESESKVVSAQIKQKGRN